MERPLPTVQRPQPCRNDQGCHKFFGEAYSLGSARSTTLGHAAGVHFGNALIAFHIKLQ